MKTFSLLNYFGKRIDFFLEKNKKIEGNGIRLKYLDGLRGVAILFVVMFHAYSANLFFAPYIHKNLFLFTFHYGNLGVFLFFLISGFVILMTLERCNTFLLFMRKRYLRLFPAMLVAVILIYLSAPYLSERPLGIPRLVDVLSPLSFIHPIFFERIFNLSIHPFEGPFWTLYLEFIFYLLFGFCYFVFNKNKAVAVLFLVSLITFTLKVVDHFKLSSSEIIQNSFSFVHALGLEHFSWFVAGALGYLFYSHRTKLNLLLFILSGFFAVMTYGHIVSLFVFLIFIIPLFYKKIELILNNKVLIFFGFISYPLYLVHDGLISSLIIKLQNSQNFIPPMLLPVLPIMFVILVAYIITKFIEPSLKKQLTLLVSSLKSLKVF